MNAFNAANAYDFAPHWNAQELTDAVPLRLHQLIDFNHDGERAVSANAAAPKRSTRPRFASAIALPLFSVR
ncbi:hypothetical protein [Lysobacter enzymogenes]|uniref:Uncharacterized protein n=1 Tax=Lysobacter enzymogenes TaxID=69 RepID=A0AAU9B5N1_LYSEN|nr:hypothetical protein [Lysobacter enzymogenes]BAV99732.1 conserved hypothetical protein [Lysobacter enzymogenes]SDY24846.1 hypothetical protein SAMN05421681_1153 [Lysobacter enzymogenes]